ncbi:hypothetical protein KSX_60720 [Ktedonospora formicarum]|uniref:Lipoprotein n=1 Tax=Ktedonospora formicarum TaxID=2778364 RepID=A0A8J3I231_9CHLR|nr:hypothetical protein KSX_60720 [Ktedonospora formicarum]
MRITRKLIVGIVLPATAFGSFTLTACGSDTAQHHKQQCELLGDKVEGEQPLTNSDVKLWDNCLKWAGSENWDTNNQAAGWYYLGDTWYYNYYFGTGYTGHSLNNWHNYGGWTNVRPTTRPTGGTRTPTTNPTTRPTTNSTTNVRPPVARPTSNVNPPVVTRPTPRRTH